MSVQLGKYQLVAEIARGGMGIVYLAVAQGPGGFSKLLVIKELKAELVDDQGFLAMFLEEARLAARLSHPNIVQTFEIGQDDSRPFMVMDYLDGVSLSRLLRRKSPLWTRNYHLRVIADVLQGLHYAHTLTDFDGTPLGIVHRDVTPHNVFVTFDGQAKLVDFGIAKALDTRIETRTGILKGKPAYMAPEQITGAVDPRSDVFSAGILLWEAAAGQRMWSKKNDVEVLASMLRGDTPKLRDVAPDAPDALVAIVERATAQKPDDRFADAAALHEALEAFLATEPVVTMREVGRVVADIFEADRARTRAVIDQHLASLRTGGVRNAVPPLAAGEPPLSTSTPASKTKASAKTPEPVPVTLAMQPLAPVSAELAAASAATSPQTLPSKKKKKLAWAPWLIGVVTLVVAVLGYVLGSHHSQTTATPVAPSASALASAMPSAVASASAAPSASVAAIETPAIETAPSASAVEKRGTPPAPRVAWSPPRPRPTVTAAAPDAPTATAPGYLTLDTYPWTRVTMGGKVLGDTPLIRVPMSPGTHVLTLENSAEKVRTTTTVVVKSGETTSRRLAF